MSTRRVFSHRFWTRRGGRWYWSISGRNGALLVCLWRRRWSDAEQALVKDVMQTDVQSCSPGDGIVEVAQAMLSTRQRRRPVIVDGRLVGQVSSSNVLWALMEYSRRRVQQS